MLFPNDEKFTISDDKKQYERLTTNFEDKSSRFKFKSQNDYSKQFAHIYATRLAYMRPLLSEKAVEKWGMLIRSLD